jgi:hypothetical protein
MTRLLATTALVGALLAAPALAQTMNSAPAAGTGAAAQPQMGAPDTGQSQYRDVKPRAARPAGRHGAPAQSSGSSMRATSKSADNSADQLNREELTRLQAR